MKFAARIFPIAGVLCLLSCDRDPMTMPGAIAGGSAQQNVIQGSGFFTEGATIPTQRQQLGGGWIDGKFYAVGGDLGHSGTQRAIVERYDPVGDTWDTTATAPDSVSVMASAVVGHDLYSISGVVEEGFSAVVWKYSSTENSWTTVASLPDARLGAAAVTIGSKIYVVGGFGSTPTSWRYTTSTGRWDARADIPASGRTHAVVIDDVIYAIVDGDPNLYVLDTHTNTWETRADAFPELGSFNSPIMAALKGVIYFSGANQPTVAYEPGTGRFVGLADNPFSGQSYAASGVFNGKIYGFGGTADEFRTSIFTPFSSGNHTPTAFPDIPTTAFVGFDTPFFANPSDLDDDDVLTTDWNFDDGGTSTDANATHAFPATGTYHISLKVSDGRSKVVIHRTVHVVLGAPVLDTYLSQSVVAGRPFAPQGSFEDPTPGGGPWTLTMKFGDGASLTRTLTTAGAIPAYTHTYHATGGEVVPEIVSVTIKNHFGKTATGTFAVFVNDNAAPTAMIDFVPGSIREGEHFTFDGRPSSDPDGDALKYAWQFDLNGVTTRKTGPLATMSFPDDGSASVVLTVTDRDGLTNIYGAGFDVINTPPHGHLVTPTKVFQNRTFELKYTTVTDSGSADTDFEFLFDCGDGHGFISTGSVRHITCTAPSQLGDRVHVGGSILDHDGDPAPDQVDLPLANAPPVPNLTVSAPSALGGNSVLPGETVTFSGSFSDVDEDGPWTYSINYGDGSISQTGTRNAQGADVISRANVYASPGNYTVTLRITDRRHVTGTFTMTVSVLPDSP